MGKKLGSVNFVALSDRKSVETRAIADLPHVTLGQSPLKQLTAVIKNHKGFIDWIESRHDELTEAKKPATGSTPKPGPKGPKEATFQKYKWYAESLVLLDLINCFEVFFKGTMTQVGALIYEYVPAERLEELKVDVRPLWYFGSENLNVAALYFEPQLFHSFRTINDAVKLLIGEQYYLPANSSSARKKQIKAVSAVFQLRHTLAHNNGVVTKSDAAKFKALGYTINASEVIDPTKNYLKRAIVELIELEAKMFTDWLRSKVIAQLASSIAGVSKDKEIPFKDLLGGTNAEWTPIKWI